MPSVAFQPTSQDLIAAYRLNYRIAVKSKRVLRVYLIGGTLVAAVAGFVASQWHFASVAVAALCGLAYWLGIFSLIMVIAYWQIPRRTRRIFDQQKALHDQTTVEWSEAGITLTSARGQSRFAWSDFIGIVADRDVIILRQSDALINFIPTRILSEEQRADITRMA